MQNKLRLFESTKIRVSWNADEEDWYFSVIDIIRVLTNSDDYQSARNYWKVLKHRLNSEGSELVTNCNRLKKANSLLAKLCRLGKTVS